MSEEKENPRLFPKCNSSSEEIGMDQSFTYIELQYMGEKRLEAFSKEKFETLLKNTINKACLNCKRRQSSFVWFTDHYIDRKKFRIRSWCDKRANVSCPDLAIMPRVRSAIMWDAPSTTYTSNNMPEPIAINKDVPQIDGSGDW